MGSQMPKAPGKASDFGTPTNAARHSNLIPKQQPEQ